MKHRVVTLTDGQWRRIAVVKPLEDDPDVWSVVCWVGSFSEGWQKIREWTERDALLRAGAPVRKYRRRHSWKVP